MKPNEIFKSDETRLKSYKACYNNMSFEDQKMFEELISSAYDNGVWSENERLLNKPNVISIAREMDAHDDDYYKITEGSFIVAERMNRLSDVMLLVKGKLERR